MQTVFAGPLHVHYGQYELFDADHDDGPEWESLKAGGVGVIGVEAGSALLLTKRHTGDVGWRRHGERGRDGLSAHRAGFARRA